MGNTPCSPLWRANPQRNFGDTALDSIEVLLVQPVVAGFGYPLAVVVDFLRERVVAGFPLG